MDNKSISTKNYVLVLTDKSKFFLDENEAAAVKGMIKSGAKYLEIGESLISVYSFSKLIGSAEYEEGEKSREDSEKIRQGFWKCDYGFWHQRGWDCGHRNSDKSP